MRITRTLAPATLVVALGLAFLPAPAQAQGRGNRGGSGRDDRREAPRQSDARRPMRGDDRGEHAVARRDAYRYQPRYEERRYEVRRYEDRRYVAPRYYEAPRRYYVAPRVYRPYYRGYEPRYRAYVFGRPYYAFRPRVSVGFGLWIGFGVPYPHSWMVEYPPPVYGYYQGAVTVVPGARTYGGISFDIAPADAMVCLDGAEIGYARDFAPSAAPLTVLPGRHRLEIFAAGFRPFSWQVDVVAGQVVPFRGEMVR